MSRVKFGAKEKDQGYALRERVYTAIIWVSNLARNYFEVQQYCLYAATIAAAVQEELKNRTCDAENAYIAAEQIFPILYQALLQHRTDSTGLATFRSDE